MSEVKKKKLFINNFGNEKISYRGYIEKIKMYNPEFIKNNKFIIGENLKGRPLFLNLDFNSNALIVANSSELLNKRILSLLELNKKLESTINIQYVDKNTDNLKDIVKLLDGLSCFNKTKEAHNMNLLNGDYLFIINGYSTGELKKSGIMEYFGKIKNINFLIALNNVDYSDNFTLYPPEVFKIILTKQVPFEKKNEHLDKNLGFNDFWYFFTNSNYLFKVQIPFIGNNKSIKYKDENYDDTILAPTK